MFLHVIALPTPVFTTIEEPVGLIFASPVIVTDVVVKFKVFPVIDTTASPVTTTVQDHSPKALPLTVRLASPVITGVPDFNKIGSGSAI